MMDLRSCKDAEILKKLENAGYEAYFVGGCVRDVLLGGGLPVDIDITTNAEPEEVIALFPERRAILTGVKHGTVTLIKIGHGSDVHKGSETEDKVEITTYRVDGGYTDHRHPDSVRYTRNLEDDLSRRDFTINAIACDIRGNLEDPFNGIEDLRKGIIRTVGDSNIRFEEDALRIMRALRFSSVLGFKIDGDTERGMFANKSLLEKISVERIFSEFKKIITGGDGGKVIRKYVEIIGVIIPELLDMKGFEQNNPYHKYDVLEHSLRAMENIEPEEETAYYMKMAALFHDVGKPATYSVDERGIGHFYGHSSKGRDMVENILRRFKANAFTIKRVSTLVAHHDLIFEKHESLLKRWMRRFSPEVLMEILQIKIADNKATGNISPGLEDKYIEIGETMKRILKEGECFSMRDLEISGNDLKNEGFSEGPEIGTILSYLLEEVVEGRIANEKKTLLEAASERFYPQ